MRRISAVASILSVFMVAAYILDLRAHPLILPHHPAYPWRPHHQNRTARKPRQMHHQRVFACLRTYPSGQPHKTVWRCYSTPGNGKPGETLRGRLPGPRLAGGICLDN